MNTFEACAIVEDFFGEKPSKKQQLKAWQHLVDSGAVWGLQGWYGRAAQGLIDVELITAA